MVGGRIVLREDRCHIDTTLLGFTVSPHEECAVEEAVRLTERLGGSVTVLTLGPPEAAEQLRSAVSVGAHHAVLLETERDDFGPVATARAVTRAVERLEAERGTPFDLLLLGNEAADTGDYQVGIRVAHALGRPVATGIKHLWIDGGAARARRTYRGTEELFSLPLPAVVTVKEGINLPRYPSLPGRLRAKRAAVERSAPSFTPEGLRKEALRVPESAKHQATVLGNGVDAVPELVRVLDELGVLA